MATRKKLIQLVEEGFIKSISIGPVRRDTVEIDRRHPLFEWVNDNFVIVSIFQEPAVYNVESAFFNLVVPGPIVSLTVLLSQKQYRIIKEALLNKK